jgi:hypothetical protein
MRLVSFKRCSGVQWPKTRGEDLELMQRVFVSGLRHWTQASLGRDGREHVGSQSAAKQPFHGRGLQVVALL